MSYAFSSLSTEVGTSLTRVGLSIAAGPSQGAPRARPQPALRSRDDEPELRRRTSREPAPRDRDYDRDRERDADREREQRRTGTPASMREAGTSGRAERRAAAGPALSDDESDHDWLDRDVDDDPTPPSFRELLEGALSSKSAPELQGIVDRARNPTQLQMQSAFTRLYRTERAVQLAVLPPRPSAEEDEYLSAPNRGAIRDLQEACRHNATLLQGIYTLAEALVTNQMDRVHISQLCADMLTYGFGAQDELFSRIKEIVRGSISSRFPPVEPFRFPDSYRPLDVLTDTERRLARKDRKTKGSGTTKPTPRVNRDGPPQQRMHGKRTQEFGTGGGEKRVFARGDQKSTRNAEK